MIAAFAATFLAAPALAEERRFTVTDFDRVQVDGPYEVRLVTGKPASARATGDAAALDRLSVDVQGRTLRIRPDRTRSGGGAGGLIIELSTHTLRGASVSGSGRLAIDRAKAMRFDLALSGSGEIALGEIAADTLNIGLLGSGRIGLGGAARQLRATIQGSGDLDAAGLTAQDAEINSDTSGTVALDVEGGAKVTATGSGDIAIGGSPACTVKALGTGRVACGD